MATVVARVVSNSRSVAAEVARLTRASRYLGGGWVSLGWGWMAMLLVKPACLVVRSWSQSRRWARWKCALKFVTSVHYVDANLHYDLVTDRAVTAILHIVNGTPTDWYSKRQATVETATYESKFMATRIAVDQIVDLRYTLMHLGVPIRSKVSCLETTHLSSQAPPFLTLSCPKDTTFQPITESGKPLPQNTSCLSGKMARPTQQTFSASIGSSLKSAPYLSHFYSGGERLLRSNSSQRGVMQIPLVFPPASHKEIRRILGWLLLPLSSCMVPT